MSSVASRTEFGSDFHLCDYPRGRSLVQLLPQARYYFDGRQALRAVVLQEGWKRIWLPTYYCYEVVEDVRQLGIEVAFYECTPLSDPDEAVSKLSFRTGDVLLRENYFGLFARRDSGKVPVDVIEDHSHNPAGDWALHSNADWCIASLRKVYPIADGGVLWSPRGHALPMQPALSDECRAISALRYAAMKSKRAYLAGEKVDKEVFRRQYMAAEEAIGGLPCNAISEKSMDIVSALDVTRWQNRKLRNFVTLSDASAHADILRPEGEEVPFSLIVLFKDMEGRDAARRALINHCIYPAVLWEIPREDFQISRHFSQRMLSIHCDGRYSREDTATLKKKLVKVLDGSDTQQAEN